MSVKKFFLELERFNSKINKIDGCWVWIGTLNKQKSYRKVHYTPVMWLNGKIVSAKRFSYSMFCNKIDDSLTISNTCNNFLCVNPKHLEALTMLQLRGKAAKKGSYKFLRVGHKPKLTDSQVKEIVELKKLGFTSTPLALKFNVCKSTINNYLKRKTAV